MDFVGFFVKLLISRNFFFSGVGMAFIADAMEMMLLSILGPALHCHWHVNHWRIAFLTTIVFLGKWQSEPFFVKSSMVCRVWKLQNFSMYLPNFMCNLSWQIYRKILNFPLCGLLGFFRQNIRSRKNWTKCLYFL